MEAYISTYSKRCTKRNPRLELKISKRTASMLLKNALKFRLSARKILRQSGVGMILRPFLKISAHHENIEYDRSLSVVQNGTLNPNEYLHMFGEYYLECNI